MRQAALHASCCACPQSVPPAAIAPLCSSRPGRDLQLLVCHRRQPTPWPGAQQWRSAPWRRCIPGQFQIAPGASHVALVARRGAVTPSGGGPCRDSSSSPVHRAPVRRPNQARAHRGSGWTPRAGQRFGQARVLPTPQPADGTGVMERRMEELVMAAFRAARVSSGCELGQIKTPFQPAFWDSTEPPSRPAGAPPAETRKR